jgi:uncharacterized membrane protein
MYRQFYWNIQSMRIDNNKVIKIDKFYIAIIWCFLVALLFLAAVFNFSPVVRLPLVVLICLWGTGFLLVKNLNIHGNNRNNFAYSVGFGLAFLIFGGLFINYLLPFFAYTTPLSTISVSLFFLSTNLLLYFRAYKKNLIEDVLINKESFNNVFYYFLSITLCASTIAGTVILNNSGNGGLVYFSFIFTSFYILYLFLTNKKIDEHVYIQAIFFIGLSLLLSFSLRSNHILGWDINEEFQVFSKTLENFRWKMSYYPNLDYNSCLSITILPTILKVLTGISPEYIFKLVFQIIFSTLPIFVYTISRKYLEPKYSLITSVLFVSQIWFFEQMPSVVRQEIAFLFYTLVLMVIFDEKLSKAKKNVIALVFFFALIVSHYSTSYIFIVLIGATFLISQLVKIIRAANLNNKKINLLLIILPLAFLFLWEVPITNTGQALSVFYAPLVSDVETKSSEIVINNGLVKDDAKKVLVKKLTLDEQFENFVKLKFASSTSNSKEVKFFSPEIIDFNVNGDSIFPAYLQNIVKIFFKIYHYIFAGLLSVVGVIYSLYIVYNKKNEDEYEFMIFNLFGICLVSLMFFIPYLNVYYNFTRLFLQMFITLSTFSVIGGIIIINKYFGSRSVIISVCVWLVFISGVGVIDQFSGGPRKIIFNRAPATSDIYYISDKEISGAKWLSSELISGDTIQSDVISNLRLQSFGDVNAENLLIVPQVISTSTFVYLTQKNIEGVAHYSYKNNLTRYNYPIDFLNSSKNLIYNNTGSIIYK